MGALKLGTIFNVLSQRASELLEVKGLTSGICDASWDETSKSTTFGSSQ